MENAARESNGIAERLCAERWIITMLLENIAPMYYCDEWENNASNDAFRIISSCMDRAKVNLPNRLVEAIEEVTFHDMYVIGLTICSNKDGPYLSIKLSDRKTTLELVAGGITYLRICGDIVSECANFPIDKSVRNPFAQVLDVWFDFRDKLDCVILLDSLRYICISANEISSLEVG